MHKSKLVCGQKVRKSEKSPLFKDLISSLVVDLQSVVSNALPLCTLLSLGTALSLGVAPAPLELGRDRLSLNLRGVIGLVSHIGGQVVGAGRV